MTPLIKIIALVSLWKGLSRHASCKFNIGDVVLPINGGYPMVIIEIHSGKKFKDPVIFCKWYDLQTNETRTNLFHQSDLKQVNTNRIKIQTS